MVEVMAEKKINCLVSTFGNLSIFDTSPVFTKVTPLTLKALNMQMTKCYICKLTFEKCFIQAILYYGFKDITKTTWMANSVDLDEAAVLLSSLIWIYIVCKFNCIYSWSF